MGCLKAILFVIVIVIFLGLLAAVFNVGQVNSNSNEDSTLNVETSNTGNVVNPSADEDGYTYVNAYVDKNGKYHKGHARKKGSSYKSNAYKSRSKSRYYYKTHKNSIKERHKRRSKSD